jgi:hypothetical protein
MKRETIKHNCKGFSSKSGLTVARIKKYGKRRKQRLLKPVLNLVQKLQRSTP